MKKYILSILTVLSVCAFAGDRVYQGTLSNAVQFIAATSTNETKGPILDLYDPPNGVVLDGISIFGRCAGHTAGATNATGNATVIVYVERSWDGVNFDTALNSDLKLTIPINGVATNQVSIYKNVGGARYLRIGRTEHISLGIGTNFAFGVSGVYRR